MFDRDKKGWTERVGLANVSPKGLYHCINSQSNLFAGEVSTGENYSNLYTNSPASNLFTTSPFEETY